MNSHYILAASAACQLTPLEQDDLYAKTQVNCHDLVKECMKSSFLEGWRVLRSKNGVSLFDCTNNLTNTYSVFAKCVMAAEVEEVAELLSCHDTTSFRALMSQLHEKEFIEGSVLHQSHQPNSSEGENEALSIKWAAFEPAFPMDRARDFCYLDYSVLHPHIRFSDATELPIAIQYFQSISRPECPPYSAKSRLERTFFEPSCYIVKPITPPGNIEVSVLISSGRNGKISFGYRAQIQQLTRSLLHIHEAIVSRRISKRVFTDPALWVQDGSRATCAICVMPFKTFRRRHHCRVCGDIMCSRCSIVTIAHLNTIGLSRLRVCKACLTKSEGNHASSPCPEREYVSEVNTMNPMSSARVTEWVKTIELEALEKQASQQQQQQLLQPHGSCGSRELNGSDLPSESRNSGNFLQHQPETSNGPYPIPQNEERRLAKLESLMILDTKEEDMFDLLSDLASHTLNCSMAAVTLIDRNRQWFKSSVGFGISQLPRDVSLCSYAIMSNKVMIVPDASKDMRFQNNRLVKYSPNIRFYASAPISTADGFVVGTVFVADSAERDGLDQENIKFLQKLSYIAMTSFEECMKHGKSSFRNHKSNVTTLDFPLCRASLPSLPSMNEGKMCKFQTKRTLKPEPYYL